MCLIKKFFLMIGKDKVRLLQYKHDLEDKISELMGERDKDGDLILKLNEDIEKMKHKILGNLFVVESVFFFVDKKTLLPFFSWGEVKIDKSNLTVPHLFFVLFLTFVILTS